MNTDYLKEKIRKYKKIYSLLKSIKIIIVGTSNLISLFFHHYYKKNVIYHFGVFGNKINVGDNVLFNKLENITDKILQKEQIWVHRNLHLGKVTFFEIFLINKISKAVVVGGHGLLMVDTNENKNSGWQFNISIKNLKKIEVPIIVTAIGYNRFRNQKDFIPEFKPHISWLVENSLHFGLRNFGSINALKRYVPERLHNKLIFQPCPTTMIASFYPEIIKKNDLTSRKIGICIAFDRYENRFGNNPNTIFEILFSYVEKIKKEGIDIQFFTHNKNDLKNEIATEIFKKRGYTIFPLYELNENKVYDFYQNFILIAGMRGHSLMIPYGLLIPVISLTTQDKQKWFIESIDHPEWNIEVESDFCENLYKQTNNILLNLEQIKKNIFLKQSEFVEISNRNINYISSKIVKTK